AQTQTVELDWKSNEIFAVDGSFSYKIPHFNHLYFNYDPVDKEISFHRSWPIESGSYEVQNLAYEYFDITPFQKFEVAAAIDIKTSISMARSKRYFNLEFSPIVEENGRYKRVTRFELRPIRSQRTQATAPQTQAVPSNGSSVFNSHQLYKFYVEKTGVHKITGAFLRQLGIDLSQLDSRRIKIYGHGGGMLPLKNSENLYFDPPEHAVQIFDGNDGVFDDNDYLLLYATATEQWNQDSKTHINLYADRSYYYVAVAEPNGKRILPIAQPSAAPDMQVDQFQDYQFYEKDEVSLALVGRRWFGDRFDLETERNYSFKFDNLVTSEPAQLKVYAGATSQLSSQMKIISNAQTLSTLNFGPTSATSSATGANYTGDLSLAADEFDIKLKYEKLGNPGATGYLDFISIEATRELIAGANQFPFKNKETAQQNGVAEYQISNANQVKQVWDVTEFGSPRSVKNTNEEALFSFKTTMGAQKEFVAITNDYYLPQMERSNTVVNRLNLKGDIFKNAQNQFEDIDFLIITRKDFVGAAEKLAALRRQKNDLVTKVVKLQDIYEEFNSGKQDIGAIRNFIRYVYSNASSPAKRVKYVALLGDTSVDFKERLPNNTNVVPTYQSYGSFSNTRSSFMSDDFFAMMDPDEGKMTSSDKMDIAVGRIIAKTPQQAFEMIRKIEEHEARPAYKSWRNNFLLISDDVDKVYEFEDIQGQLDNMGDEIALNRPTINVKKIHSDAYEQQPSAGGDRYPAVNKAINEAIEVGAIVVNYFGHGGEEGLAQERIVTQSSVQNWTNPSRYNVFVTITCDFTKFDNPLRETGGEMTYWNPTGGAVAMVATTRSITVSAGVDFNNEFAPFLFDYANTKETIAESVMNAKNNLSGSGKRIVFYIGDPTMRLPLPEPRVKISHINDVPFNQFSDTLQALEKAKIKGRIVDANGQKLAGYQGELTTSVFDKRIERSTLGNDNVTQNGELLIMDFTTLGELLFNGKASIDNGEFEFSFVLPKDTKIPVGEGRFSFYANRDDALEEYSGASEDVKIGGLNQDAPDDNQGPLVNAFMNDESFVNGGVTNTDPYILALLEDDNGINTAGGIGHDIVAILDGDEENPIILNDYYEADMDTYQSGKVYYQLKDIEPGPHRLTLKAWDVYNNSAIAELDFVVSGDDELRLTNVLNYPNPFVDYTEFWFNHNRPFEPLNVQVQVYTVTGKIVWSHQQTVTTDGFLSRDIVWNGLDDFGQKIGKGVYVYKLTVESTITNQKQEKYEKLVILQ
ncbi:MAG: type IX secretion system sortase PorU, partial [Psychroflexus sp.]|nr:type IX secretion system sortase PorU [Psychroflexus sp.]